MAPACVAMLTVAFTGQPDAGFATAVQGAVGSSIEERQGRAAISGIVRFQGTPPPGEQVDFGTETYCAEQHSAPLLESAVAVGLDGGLRNVVVYLREAPVVQGGPPDEAVRLDQVGCVYTPRVVALRAGQTLLIRNSDATLHNVHVRAQKNREFNIGQPIRGITSRRVFEQSEVGIHVSCDVHGWMKGAIAIFDHPWFAVSDENGSFAIEDVPPGEYILEAWHESLGVRQQQVTVRATGDADVSFTFGS
ncbi:MAG: carboxypeptidase regulatory-like domain-containing protein [Longimicrobiales bacterium]